MGQKNVLYDIVEKKKTTFYGIKTTGSKSRKIDIFSKGLTHGSGPKMTIFTTFFLGNIGQKNVFYDILEPKNYFLRHKNKKTSQAKTLIGQ